MSRARNAAVVLCCVLLLATPLLSADERAALPPLEVVQELRRARIAESSDRLDIARNALESLVSSYPQEVLPLARLVAFHDTHDNSYAGLAELRSRLTARLADPERPLPEKSLRYLVFEQALQDEQLRALEGTLLRRLKTTQYLATEELELRESLGVLYRRLEDPERARANLARIIELSPTFSARWRALRIDLELGRWEDALEIVSALAAEPAPSPGILLTRLQILARLGRGTELVQALSEPEAQNLLSEGPVLSEVAWALEDAGEAEAAKKLWERILEQDPENRAVRETLLYLHGSEEDQRAAASALADRWSDEEDPNALLERGTDLLAAGDAEGALALLVRAAPEFPGSEMAWYNLGLAAFRLERWEIVAEAFGTAASLNAKRSESFYNQGLALFELERCQEALAPLERTLALTPERFQARYYRAGCLAKLGRNDEAALEMQRYRAARDGG